MSKATGNWFVPRMWDFAECWILGGGISMPRQFGVPEKVIQAVREQKKPITAYNKYFKALHEKHIIGTNVAYKLGHWISVLYFGDLPFYRNNMLDLHTFYNLKITDTGNLPNQNPEVIQNHNRIKKLIRDVQPGLSEDPKKLRWNHNAGAGAINLASLFGAKRILLLGFDMKADSNGHTHWQTGRPGYRHDTEQKHFDRFLKCFSKIAVDAARLGIEILNVNPDSALDDFPKVSLKEVL
jgi:hypothetical protein